MYFFEIITLYFQITKRKQEHLELQKDNKKEKN